jgi:hypothetical protein
VLLVVTVWLFDLARPHHDHFLSRRTPIKAARVLEETITVEGLHHSLVELAAESGLKVRFRVLRRDVAHPLPLVVLLAGHRTGSNAVELIGDPGEIVVAALDYPYEGPEKFRGIWHGLTNLGVVQQALLDTPPAVSVAVDWLVQQPWIDSARVELIGASLGTPFAAVAGALDKRFRRVWLLHGGADNRAWLEASLRHRIASRPTRVLAASTLHLLAHGASFDTAMWVAQIAPRSVVVTGATDDESLSRENIESLYAAAGEPRELLWTTGGHVTRKNPEIVRELLGLVRARIVADGLPAQVTEPAPIHTGFMPERESVDEDGRQPSP